MHRREGKLIYSATDLVAFLECGHRTVLDRALLDGLKHKPDREDDPALELLRRRGHEHERRYVAELEQHGRRVTALDGSYTRPMEDRVAETLAAMARGDDVIYQATLFSEPWVGHPDFLLKVDGPPPHAVRPQDSSVSHFADHPSGATDAGPEQLAVPWATDSHQTAGQRGGLGHDWHYEVADTKLARSAKASALIQMCSYVDLLERHQGGAPARVYVVTAGATIASHPFRTAEMMAYYRHAKRHFGQALERDLQAELDQSYPDPVEHCGVCRWFYVECRQRWRDDDALPLVAGIGRKQRELLKANEVTTMTALSTLDRPIALNGMKRSQADSLWRMREQARLQVASKGLDKPNYELLEPERDAHNALVADRGLSALPPPSAHDLFFDIEGDPFAFWEGLEYLFGVWDGALYTPFWAKDRTEEKQAFEKVMRLFHGHWQQHREMHVYHYGAYEPSRLKQLAGRHATMQEELDELLRARVFVDLLRVVRQGVRVGSERYSIKNLEPLYDFRREVELRDAGSSIVEFELFLETGGTDETLTAKIADYNADDCRSTQQLRDWLEQRRLDAQRQFSLTLPRPSAETKAPNEEFTERQARVKALEERLTANIPEDPTEQTDADRATWLLRHLLDWHRRENKSAWWRFYDLMSLAEDELFDATEPIAHLEFVERIVRTGKGVRTDDWRYRFPPQEHKVDPGNEVHDPEAAEGESKTGTVAAVDDDARTVDIRRPKTWDGRHPEAIVPLNIYKAVAQQDALFSIGEWVATNGIESPSAEWQAARDLLLRRPPRCGQAEGEPLARPTESGADAAVRIGPQLAGTTLAIQGPPGSGKSTIGAQMIVDLVCAGKRVGVTANSHKVINNLLQKVGREAERRAVTVRAMHKVDDKGEFEDGFAKTVGDNGVVASALANGEVDVVGGTAWLWARDEMNELVETLFVDEAGQMSLANVVAMSGSARNVVLLGDPQQLDQPIQGAHPPGAERSALGHFLGESETVDPRHGIFFEQTWRLNPAICDFTSTLFYESRLEPLPGLDGQEVLDGPWAGSGLRWVPVPHDGNTNESLPEAQRVVQIVSELVGRPWRNKDGEVRDLTPEDVLIVSPFNAHRLTIGRLLAEAGLAEVAVGTVDKFQGQEAAVSIFTMATSRPEDAPRGVDFLYSLNRLNVATSRARALAIVVASPRLLDFVPRTPDQLRMANGLAAFVEHGTR